MTLFGGAQERRRHLQQSHGHRNKAIFRKEENQESSWRFHCFKGLEMGERDAGML